MNDILIYIYSVGPGFVELYHIYIYINIYIYIVTN